MKTAIDLPEVPLEFLTMLEFSIRKLNRELLADVGMPAEAKPIITNYCAAMLDEIIPLPNKAMQGLPHVKKLMRDAGEGRSV